MPGITRKIDDLGRVVIPKELRRNLNIAEYDELEIEVVPAGILLSPIKASCAACGSTRNLTVLDRFALCDDCMERMNRIREEAVDHADTEESPRAVPEVRQTA